MLYFPVIEHAEDLDLTPLLTTCEYSGPVTSYMPIATARFAFARDLGAVFVLCSFDTHPFVSGDESMEEDSIVCAAFNFFPESGSKVARIIANSEGRCFLQVDGGERRRIDTVLLHGEDERGIYWGVRAEITRDMLAEIYGEDEIKPGKTLLGNVFKQKAAGAGKHLGAIAPFGGDGGIFDDRNLREFTAELM